MLTLCNSIHSGKNMRYIYIRMQMEHKPSMFHHICSFGRGNRSWKPAKDQINTVLQFIWIKLQAPWQYAILCFLFKNWFNKLMQRFYLWKKKTEQNKTKNNNNNNKQTKTSKMIGMSLNVVHRHVCEKRLTKKYNKEIWQAS